MISRNLFFKLIKQDIRKRIWCPLLIFIACFPVMEVYLLIRVEVIQKYPQAFSYDVYTFVNNYFFGDGVDKSVVLVCAAAFLCALTGYAYVHSKVQLDTYHSLPVSRTQLFWSRYVSGLLQFFLPFLIHTLICAGIAIGRNVFNSGTFYSIFEYLGINLVFFVLTYSASILAVALTGNIVASILGVGIMFSYSTIISTLKFLLFDQFFDSFVFYGSQTDYIIREGVWCFSPLSMIMKLFANHMVEYIWVLVVAALIYSLTAYLISLRRPSEAAGKMIVFSWAEPVIKTILVIPSSFFCAMFFPQFSYSGTDKWFLLGLIFGYVLLACMTEVIFRMDIKGIWMHKRQFLFNAACTFLIFTVLKEDVLGYDTYVPADSQIQSCAVLINGLMPNSYRVCDQDSKYCYYLDIEQYSMENMELQGNPSVTELARMAATDQYEYQVFDYYDGIENDPKYMEILQKQENYRWITYGYKLLNGKMIYRQYLIDISNADTLRMLADIFNDYDYKIGSTPLFLDGWNAEFSTVRCVSNWDTAVIELTPDKRSRLLEAYQSEYTKLTFDTIRSVIPVGTIDFLGRENSDYCSGMLIYPQFTNTIALLQEYGFHMENQLTMDNVESISVESNSGISQLPYIRGIYGYERVETISEATYTNEEQIQQILENIVKRDNCESVKTYTDFVDTNYTVFINLKQTGAEEYHRFSYYFKTGCVPDFVSSDVQ